MNTVKIFTFKDLEKQLVKNFKSMEKLFYVEIDREKVFEEYLRGFPTDDLRQEHNCNCCKSFLRQYGGIVTIKDNKVISLWDNLEVSEEYEGAIKNLREYIHSLPVAGVFLTRESKCGTQKTLAMSSGILWEHFYLEPPSSVVMSDPQPAKAQARDDKNVLERSLKELTQESTETVLELIAQSSLYRGKEFEPILQKFLKLHKAYDKLPDETMEQLIEKDNFCWIADAGPAVSRIRNTAIGTLLIDLSAGLDLDSAVTKFERVVAPSNYKRPTSLVTPKMVEQAKETIKELGLLESLNRRYANEADIRVSDIIFKDTPTVLTDVFDEVAKETLVNPKTFSKVEEMSIEDFMTNVVPGAKSISVLLENKHMGNFVSLITAQDPETLSPFKWGNSFSWSYTGAVTDSIKERVKEAGGRVDGELRTSLSWFNHDDLDIHVLEPSGFLIHYRAKVNPATTGILDVDMNAGGGTTRTPVENVIWTNKAKMQEGIYKILVNNYAKRENKDSGYIIQIECAGQVFDFEFKTSPGNQQTHTVAEFTYSRESGITFKGEVKSNVVSKEKWGLKTNQFHKVSKLMLSPNYWRSNTGNRHFLFMLEGCVSDEAPRPFFNEFLRQDLDAHRKVFEIIGGKIKIEDTPNQLSGIGFSETIRNSLIVKVLGTFNRMIKVNI